MSLDLERATSLIIERARQLANCLIQQRKNETPPFSSEDFARLLHVTKIEKLNLGDGSALLLKSNDDYVIKVNANHHPVRQNFSCAHELGHILFNQLGLEPYLQCIEYRGFNPQARALARARDRERLCEAAAAELLMPESVFKKYLSGFGVGIGSVERLANTFRVSYQSVAIRIAEVSIEPCIALLWRPWQKTRSKGKGLRLAWCVGPGINSRNKGFSTPVHKYVPPPSPLHTSTLHKAYQYDSPVKSFNKFKVDNATEKRLPMESKGFGRNETRYVISLAFLDR